MERDFELFGHTYRAGRMKAQTETRVFKRLLPLLAPMVPLLLRSDTAPGAPIELQPDPPIGSMILVVIESIGRLPDADQDFIERAALGALSRREGDEWQPVWIEGDDEPAFDDIDGAVMQALVGHSLACVAANWRDRGGDAWPAEFRNLVNVLH